MGFQGKWWAVGITPAIQASALRVSIQLFKFIPDEFVLGQYEVHPVLHSLSRTLYVQIHSR